TVRIVAAGMLVAVGLGGVPGAMGATLLGTSAGLLVPLWSLRPWLRRVRSTYLVTAGSAISHLNSIAPVVLGLLAITSLTTIDVVVAKLAFNDATAGIYGSASLIGRVILYLPAAVVTVLLPKVTSRAAANRSSAE